MSFVRNVPAFSILLLIFSGVICLPLNKKWAARISSLAFALVSAANIWLLTCFAGGMDSFTYSMGHFPAPYGNELRAGMLEAALASLFCVICLLSIMGGRNHIEHDIPGKKGNMYYISVIFLLCSMLALVYTNDLFTAYVFIEINTITACAIVMSKSDGRTLAATMSYLIMSLIGSGLFLIGVCIIYGVTGHLLMSPIQNFIAALPAGSPYFTPINVSVALFAVSMSIKSALWPFSFWLPGAHGNATASSSSILSGLVLKAYIVTLIKVFYRVIGIDVVKASGVCDIILIVGVCAMIAGSMKALKEDNLKRMLAFSSIAQIGYVFCGIGLASRLGMTAAIIQIGVHAATKSLLFTTAGGFMDTRGGSKKISDMHGAAKDDPFAGLGFIVGSMSMVGIPLFAGFVTKYALVLGALNAEGWRLPFTVCGIILSTVLTAIYYTRTLARLYRSPEDPNGAGKRFARLKGIISNLSKEYIIAIIALIIINFAIGLNTDRIIVMIETGLNMFA